MQCEAITKKGHRCPIQDAAIVIDTGTYLCHVHHPSMVFQQQMAAKREERDRRERRKRKKRAQSKRDPVWVATPPIKF